MGLILDTSELILAERRKQTVGDLLNQFAQADELVISVVTLAELQHGVRRADNPARAAYRKAFLTDVLAAFVVVQVTPAIAIRAGDLEAELELRGEGLPLPDLLIAATALEADLPLATHNVRHFIRVPGLRLHTTS
jgi:predicted nucleic acid-binding protein